MVCVVTRVPVCSVERVKNKYRDAVKSMLWERMRGTKPAAAPFGHSLTSKQKQSSNSTRSKHGQHTALSFACQRPLRESGARPRPRPSQQPEAATDHEHCTRPGHGVANTLEGLGAATAAASYASDTISNFAAVMLGQSAFIFFAEARPTQFASVSAGPRDGPRFTPNATPAGAAASVHTQDTRRCQVRLAVLCAGDTDGAWIGVAPLEQAATGAGQRGATPTPRPHHTPPTPQMSPLGSEMNYMWAASSCTTMLRGLGVGLCCELSRRCPGAVTNKSAQEYYTWQLTDTCTHD